MERHEIEELIETYLTELAHEINKRYRQCDASAGADTILLAVANGIMEVVRRTVDSREVMDEQTFANTKEFGP